MHRSRCSHHGSAAVHSCPPSSSARSPSQVTEGLRKDRSSELGFLSPHSLLSAKFQTDQNKWFLAHPDQ